MQKKKELKAFQKELLLIFPFLSDSEGEIVNLHQARVAILASAFAHDIVESNRELVFLSGLYHDIGAVGSTLHPLRVLNMADYFVDPWLVTHPIRTAQILRRIEAFNSLAEVVLEHHEWFDGGGFPFKKKSQEILPEAQVLRIVDSFDSAMLVTGKVNHALRLMERTSGKEYDEDLFCIFKHYVKTNDFEHLWYEPAKTLDEAILLLKRINFRFDEESVFEMLKVFDLKKKPIHGHTKRVRDLVALFCGEIGYFPADSLVRAAYIHEAYTLYEPFKGSYLGSVLKNEVIEKFELIYQAFLDLETDPFVSEVVNAACYLDSKLYPSYQEMKKDEVISVLLNLNGRLNPEVVLAFKKVIDNHGHALFKENIVDGTLN